MYSKPKLTLKTTVRDKYDKNKQIRALMPNLIHSLDGSSLIMLYDKFNIAFDSKNTVQFFSNHDCFATMCDKVSTLKTILASVYTEIYQRDKYLLEFDRQMLNNIKENTDVKFDEDTRTVQLDKTKYTLFDVK